jgi:AraC-like DNA-binding protein
MDNELLKNIFSADLIKLFNFIPGVQFWIKDTNSVFIWANRALLENYALNDISEIIGKTDYDLSPRYIAEQFVRDDKEVLKGKEIVDRIELMYSIDQSINWFITNKRPINNAKGKVIGTMGITRKLDKATHLDIPIVQLDTFVNYIHSNINKPINIVDMAKATHCSVSTLERKFRNYLHMTPFELYRKIKMQYACKMLINSHEAVTQVAYKLGYADQSHFIREFKRFMGTTPHQYKKHYFKFD